MLDLVLVLAFVAYSVSAGLRARRMASRDLGEFFLAGRTLRGWQAGASMAATQFAADTPLLVTGLVAAGGCRGCGCCGSTGCRSCCWRTCSRARGGAHGC
ncbi:hypothetical protein [Nannocystis pusilla]|uniref:hypothetical protein n=1 Tax=Nannocystis pusilla TaxID=889268 RepID=UPI003B7CFC75